MRAKNGVEIKRDKLWGVKTYLFRLKKTICRVVPTSDTLFNKQIQQLWFNDFDPLTILHLLLAVCKIYIN